MLKLTITVKPKSEKYLELSQSLEFIKSDLAQLCCSVLISEKNKTFLIEINIRSVEQLVTVLHNDKLKILSGAINLLGEKSEITIEGAGHQIKGNDLREIRRKYFKTKNEPIKLKQ